MGQHKFNLRKFYNKNKMKNKDIAKLISGINNVGSLKGVKFAYAMAKNRKKLDSELETLKEANKLSDEFIKQDEKRVELAKKFADKDEKGNPKTKEVPGGSSYLFNGSIEPSKEFEDALKDLRNTDSDYKKAVEDRESQEKEFTDLLNKESSYVPHMVKLSDIPTDITSAQMDGIRDLIEE